MKKVAYLFAILLFSGSIWSQQVKKVSGSVVDEIGFPLAGVDIRIVGSGRSTMTDFNGKFEMEVVDEDVLRFTYPGFQTQEVPVGANTEFNVVMPIETEAPKELVTVGYGSQRREDLSMSISSLTMNDELLSRPVSLEEILQGRMAGVTIQLVGGDPVYRNIRNKQLASVNHAGNTVSIRGRGSRAGDAVLVLVDGVPNAPYNIDDIENVSVLKDAASAAMYGAYAGSGGVIVITTKKPKPGKVSLSINSSTGFNMVAKTPKVISAEDFVKLKWQSYMMEGVQEASVPGIYKDSYFAQTRTDWFKEIFRTSISTRHSLSVSGATDNFSGVASIRYENVDGTLLNTFSESIVARLNGSYKIAKWLTLTENLSYSFNDGRGGSILNQYGQDNVLMSALLFPRSARPYEIDKDGNKISDGEGGYLFEGTTPRYIPGVSSEENKRFSREGGFGAIRNPLATLKRLDEFQPSHTLFTTTTLLINPIEELTINANFTHSVHNQRYEAYFPKVLEKGNPNQLNRKVFESLLAENWLLETTIAYKKEYRRHYFDAIAGFITTNDRMRTTNVVAEFFESDKENMRMFSKHKNVQTNPNSPSEVRYSESGMSAFGRFGYNFDDRYFMTASVRWDATSKLFGKNNWGLFKSGSLAWKLSSEPFMIGAKHWLSLLKFRASYGEVGNKATVPFYSYADVFKDNQNFIGGNGKQTIGVNKTIGNKDLTWETTSQIGGGVDIELFNSLTLSFDYFQKTTDNLIEVLSIPTTLGYLVPPYGNVGKVLNKGFEIELGFKKKVGIVDLNFIGNFSTLTNQVLALNNDQSYATTVSGQQNILRSTVGQPWYSYHLLRADGIFKNKFELGRHVRNEIDPNTGIALGGDPKKIQPDAKVGDLRFLDLNYDARLNDDDREYMGSYMPKYTYAFGGGLKVAGVDFSFFFNGVYGNKIYNQFRAVGLTGHSNGYLLDEAKYSWTPTYTNTDIPRLSVVQDKNGNASNSSYFLEDGSYLRLKTITIGYSVSESLMNFWGMSGGKLRIYATAENVLTFTKYTGMDPEVGNLGVDMGTWPIPRTISLGFNFNF